MGITTPKQTQAGKDENAAALLALAQQARQNGQPDGAMQFLREAIARYPEDAQPYFYLGVLLNDANRADEALTCFEKAMAIEPDNVALQINRANVLQKLGQLEQAELAYQDVLGSHPGMVIGHFNLGLVYQRAGKWPEAAARFRTTLELNPDMAEAWQGLARALARQGQLQNAFEAYQQVLRRKPGNLAAHRELGDLLREMGAYGQAERAYVTVLKQRPDDARALHGIGQAQQKQGRFDDAIASFRKAIELDPGQLWWYVNLGDALHQIGKNEEKAEQYRRALQIDPTFAPARLALCINQLPAIYRDEQELQDSRTKYSNALEELHQYYLQASPEERSQAAVAVGFLQPYYLPYQGLPVRDLQERYGQLMSLLMEARYPQFVDTVPMPAVKDKIRLGFVSGYLCNHSGWNYFKGMAQAIDRSRFELHMFHTGNHRDRETKLLEHLCDCFVHGPLTTQQWSMTIRQQRLHAVIFPEIGMDQTAMQLGCLRLAPIQLTSWGHPVTSGLRTIDYYLSSELMEPADAQSHYAEKLVRLPNLAMHIQAPDAASRPRGRQELNLPENAIIYWCCQYPSKYLPQHDDVFPRIARHVKNAAFVFLSLLGRNAEQRFKERLNAAFAREGLNMREHCHFLPRLPAETFTAVTAASDIYLDNIGWSGCNTSLQAIATDRPILTLPGGFMRGRHTLAFLKMMGLDECIAADKDQYIAMAVRLGQDETLRQTLSGVIRTRKHALYRDPQPVRALESFLEQAIRSYRPQAPVDDRASGQLTETTEFAGGDADDHQARWERGISYQRQGKLDRAAAAFRSSLELSNPLYRMAAPGPLRPPSQPATLDSERVELAGLSYPAVAPVSGSGQRPFWSVVIPVYNRDKYLLECLTSVLAQWPGDEEMEIIVIDNSSNPALRGVVQSVGKSVVRYHYHPARLSLQHNWNSAINASRGYWVHLLHDDDYVLPGFYQKLKDALVGASDTVGAAFTAYENINENDAVTFKNFPGGSHRGIARDWINKIAVSNVLNPPAIVVRRDAYENLGGYSDQILYTIDWEMYMRLASHYDWWYEPEILARYRQHRLNVTTEQDNAGAQGESLWRAIEMAEHYLPTSARAGLVARSRRHYFTWCLSRLRLPLQAGNTPGTLRMLREMLHIDCSEDSLQDLFDWLATTFAAPLWPALIDTFRAVEEPELAAKFDTPAGLFDWLCCEGASGTRKKLAQAVRKARTFDCHDDFRLTPSAERQT